MISFPTSSPHSRVSFLISVAVHALFVLLAAFVSFPTQQVRLLRAGRLAIVLTRPTDAPAARVAPHVPPRHTFRMPAPPPRPVVAENLSLPAAPELARGPRLERMPGPSVPTIRLPEAPQEPRPATPAFASVSAAVPPRTAVMATITGAFAEQPKLAVPAAPGRPAGVRTGMFGEASDAVDRAAPRRVVAGAGLSEVVSAVTGRGRGGGDGTSPSGFDSRGPERSQTSERRASSAGAFATAAFAAGGTAVGQTPAATVATSPIEVLSKLRPDYTEEARRLKIEGEVVVEALFTAAGSVEVLRVVQGLGHGLDQRAIDAVRRIQFRPAERNGHPVDFAGTVRIRFQLAY